jgi:diguanylate cyclase (GGDEF)-like protein
VNTLGEEIDVLLTKIGDISEQIPIVSPTTTCDVINKMFKNNPKLEGIAVVGEDNNPALLMRPRFYQLLGTEYGYNLYMGRPVILVMNSNPLVVNFDEQITDVSIRAMNRAEEELYDGVLVIQEGRLHGFVSIRRVLLEVANIRVEMAIFMNPLTGLPGNRIIEEKLQQSTRLHQCSVIYIDLDHFKSFNDSYGFKMGDSLLQATADLLREQFSGHDTFLGHIGGDDFIAILDHHNYEFPCSKVIEGFEKMKQDFYNTEDITNNYVIGETRSGIFGPIPLVSISIAVVTNRNRSFQSMDQIVEEATRMKKICKSSPGSVTIAN